VKIFEVDASLTLLWFDVNWKFCKSYISHRVKTHIARLSAHPTKRHVELVANSETGSTGLKKARVLCALSRSLCHEVCPVRDCSAPVVPRQE